MLPNFGDGERTYFLQPVMGEKDTSGGIGQNRPQEKRESASSGSHFFLKQKKCESLEKNQHVSRDYLFC